MATKRNGHGAALEDPPRVSVPEPHANPHAGPGPNGAPDPRGNGPDGFLPAKPPRAPIALALRPDGYAVLPEGNPCEGCDHCCRYVAIEIDRPTTKKDFENIRWYLLHRSISIIIDWDGAWLIQFDTPCEWLVDGRCRHYELRPEICREYDPKECERYLPTQSHKVLMKTEADLRRYLEEREARLEKRRAARARREARAKRESAARARARRNGARPARVRAGSRTGRAPAGR